MSHQTGHRRDYAALGRFGSTHGVRGWIKFFSFTDSKLSVFTDHAQFFVSRDERDWKLIELEGHRAQGNDYLLKLKGVDSPEAARLFTHFYLAVLAEELPVLPEGEYYWRDLVGLSVYDQRNQFLGKVDYLMETGANDVLVLDSKPQIAIPYLMKKVIQSIDLKSSRMDVNWEWE